MSRDLLELLLLVSVIVTQWGCLGVLLWLLWRQTRLLTLLVRWVEALASEGTSEDVTPLTTAPPPQPDIPRYWVQTDEAGNPKVVFPQDPWEMERERRERGY